MLRSDEDRIPRFPNTTDEEKIGRDSRAKITAFADEMINQRLLAETRSGNDESILMKISEFPEQHFIATLLSL